MRPDPIPEGSNTVARGRRPLEGVRIRTGALKGCQNPNVPSTYSNLNVHVVFATKQRKPLIAPDWMGELHAYIGGVFRNLAATAFAVGGMKDHVHVIAGLRATHAPADLVREVKKASSLWAAVRCPRFAWQEGYGAFSESAARVPEIIAYIARQEDHHRRVSSAEELKALLAEHGIAFDECYFE
jgi:putative transposase